MTVIEISDDLAVALKAQAPAHGLQLESWLQKLAGHTAPADRTKRAQAAAARIREISRRSKPDPEGLTARNYIDCGRP